MPDGSNMTRPHYVWDEAIPEREGEFEDATRIAANNVEVWLYRAARAETWEQRLHYLNKAISLLPEDSTARLGMYETLKGYLERDPFLRYIEEGGDLYRVLVGGDHVAIVPKDRAAVAAYPPKEPSPLRSVFRWLGLSLLGLPLAGILTFICAPIAAILALRISLQSRSVHDSRRGAIAFLCACVLWAIGVIFSFLFVLHLFG